MGTYFDIVPGDVNRMIEEYANREILVVPKGRGYITSNIFFFDIVFPGPVTFTIPFAVDIGELRDFLGPTTPDYEYMLISDRTQNSIKRTRGTIIIYGYATIPIAQLNPRQSVILVNKLKKLL